MREIKFRAWDEDKKQMWTPEFIANPHGRPAKWETDGTMHVFYHQILMQFTGLHDKNGKEIYEGDIVQCNQGTFEVKWDNDYSLYRFGGMAAADHPWPLEVIGNIYENPELIPAHEK